MNAKQLVIAVAVLSAAGSVFAGEMTEYVDHSSFTSTKTRAQVRDELDQARAQGLMVQSEYVTFNEPNLGPRGIAGARHAAGMTPVAGGSNEYVDFSHFVSTRTRAQVRTELEQSRAQGLPVQREYVGQ